MLRIVGRFQTAPYTTQGRCLDCFSAEEEELGVARGAMCDAEAGEVQASGGRMAAVVAAIPLHLVYASAGAARP